MTILKGWRIHHSSDASQCPTCKLLKDYGNNQPPPLGLVGAALTRWQNKLNKAHTHKHIAQTQHNAHKQLKNKMIDTQSKDTMIILQDFTQLEPQTGFNQDMILTTLRYDAQEPDKIKRQYYHFVGEQHDKNDIYFVISVWEHIMKRDDVIPKEIKTIHI